MRPIYLDYNATTPLAPKVQAAMLPFLAEQFGNPLSDHVLGRAAMQAIEDARYRVASAIGAAADEVYFCSGATESCRHAVALSPDGVTTTAVDHWAMREACDASRCRVLPVSVSGIASPDSLAKSGQRRSLLSVVHANNEIGLVQPVAEFASCASGTGARLHSDSAQSLGKIPVNVGDLGVDLLTVTAHKCYGPKGAGALYVRRGIDAGPVFCGGALISPGTPDVAAIVGFGAAAELSAASLEQSIPRMATLRDRLQQQLQEGVGDDLVVWGEQAERLPNTLAVAFPSVVGEQLLAACPEICATPLASKSGDKVTLSSTLRAIGADPEIAQGSVRLSVGWYTDEDEIDRAASLLLDAWERLR